MFVLSNTNGIHIEGFNEILEAATGYANLQAIGAFDKVYYSYEVGLRKPDADIFSYVLQDAGLDPAHTLFMDDGPVNLAGAQSVGLQTQLITPEYTIMDLFA